eukprot:7274311-Prymnesium_polylepis.1
MTKYLTNPTTGLVYSGLPRILLHVKVASPEAAVEEIRKYDNDEQRFGPPAPRPFAFRCLRVR